MRIFARGTLRDFWIEHPKAEIPLRAFYSFFEKRSFANPNEIKTHFSSADIVGDGKIIFNICGNDYRLVVKFNYKAQMAFIRFIGTHKEYDGLDVDSL